MMFMVTSQSRFHIRKPYSNLEVLVVPQVANRLTLGGNSKKRTAAGAGSGQSKTRHPYYYNCCTKFLHDKPLVCEGKECVIFHLEFYRKVFAGFRCKQDKPFDMLPKIVLYKSTFQNCPEGVDRFHSCYSRKNCFLTLIKNRKIYLQTPSHNKEAFIKNPIPIL